MEKEGQEENIKKIVSMQLNKNYDVHKKYLKQIQEYKKEKEGSMLICFKILK